MLTLGHGDEILVGSTRFCFLVDDVAVSPSQISFEEDPGGFLVSTDTTRLRPQDLVNDRSTQDIGVLLQLSTEISHIDTSEKLQAILLERLFKIVPAQEGVILLGAEVVQLFGGQPVQRQRIESGKRIRVSRTIVEQVFNSRESLLQNDLLATAAHGKHNRIGHTFRSVRSITRHEQCCRRCLPYDNGCQNTVRRNTPEVSDGNSRNSCACSGTCPIRRVAGDRRTGSLHMKSICVTT